MLADAERAGIKRRELSGVISSLAVGRRKPRFATHATFLDTLGRTWTQRNVTRDGAPTIDVFDHVGRFCGNIVLPHPSRLLEVRFPLLLTVRYRDDGGESFDILLTTSLACPETLSAHGNSLML